ncbi:MAG TPA: Rrf2 family transcriptional regulator [Geminicoccaceae bacterium]|nr:Rrf2 family transcriptional regulator [Geminicoccaceae bacterium]
MLSQKAKYALRALLVLAEEGDKPVLISDIAERHNLPKKFLEQILLDLKHHGLVQSRRGRSGGYALLKPASEISFGQVVRIIDGPLAPLPCLSVMAYRRCEDCIDEATCAIRRVFALTHQVTATVLDRTTLADAIKGGAARPSLPQREVA